VLNRHRVPGKRKRGFHDACGRVEELSRISREYCHDDGSINFTKIPELEASENREKSSRGLILHVAEVRLDREHRGKGLGPRFVDALLRWPELTQCGMSLGWTFAALSVGTLRERGDDCGAVARTTAWEEEVKVNKVCRAWARVGFKQCRVGSDTWYLVPENHTPGELLTKVQVADVRRWPGKVNGPGFLDLQPADRALLAAGIGPIVDLGLTVDGVTTLVNRCFKIELAVAAGGNATRARLLHCVLAMSLDKKGVGVIDLRDLVVFIVQTLKVDVNAVDFYHYTALHVAATFSSPPEVVSALLMCGADKDAITQKGHTPFGAWYQEWDERSARVRRREGVDDLYVDGVMDSETLDLENDKFKLDVMMIQMLIPDSVTAILTDGLLSPRMLRRLRMRAGDLAEIASYQIIEGEAEFVNDQPKCRYDLDCIPGLDHIPTGVTKGDLMCKSFAKGFGSCLMAMHNVLASGKLPTPQLVEHEVRGSDFDSGDTAKYFGQGGRVEFAIDAVLESAEQLCLDGSFEKDEGLWDEGYEPSLAVPELDENFDLIRSCLLGPLFRRGPFWHRRD